MQRSTLPLLLLVLLVGAVFFYFRPIQSGDLAALAQNWSLPAWSNRDPGSALEGDADDFNRRAPRQPTATARPASWPANPSRASASGADAASVPRRVEAETSPRGYEYPDTGLPPYDVSRAGSPDRPGQTDVPVVGRIDNPPYDGRRIDNPPYEGRRVENPPYDVISDPFGDRVPTRESAGGRFRRPNESAPPGENAGDRQPPLRAPYGPPAPAPGARVGSPPGADSGIPCQGAEILARVGNDVILAREVSMGIAEIRENNKDTVPPSVLEEKIREILKKQVEKRVEEKLICLDAQRKVPKDKYSKILDHYGSVYEKYQIPEMMKQGNLGSRRELEQKLRAAGITLQIHKQAFIESVLAQGWLESEVKPEQDISYEQILTYYREHAAEFTAHPPLSRWEQLMVRTARFPSREAAYAALAEMGNQVLDGVPLAEVAKARSQGATAAQGGLWDWTGKGNLMSKVLDEAIFAIPIGRLSPILEDEQGFHIVRVLQRQGTAMKPFADAQVDIKKKIRAQRQTEAKAAFIAKLREQTAVSTAFDNDRDSTSARLDALFH